MTFEYKVGIKIRFSSIVQEYQKKLNAIRKKYHYTWANLSVDGFYGCKTANTVKEFQKAFVVTPIDGILGPTTMRAIDCIYNKPIFIASQELGDLPANKNNPILNKTVIETNASAKYDTFHFTIKELCYSSEAKRLKIDNTPNSIQKLKLQKLIEDVLEPIRMAWGKPLQVNSGYRSRILNDHIGGSETSQHCQGEAADIVPIPNSKKSRKDLFLLILKMINSKELNVGQLIWEFGDYSAPLWVHVSLPYKKTNDVISIPFGLKAIWKDNKTSKIYIS